MPVELSWSVQSIIVIELGGGRGRERGGEQNTDDGEDGEDDDYGVRESESVSLTLF